MRDERTSAKPTKPVPKTTKNRPASRDDESDNFDPDTLERGLGGDRKNSGKNPERVKKVISPDPSVISSDLHNPDYSFRLFKNGQPVETSGQPPELPPKTRSSSSVYSSTSVSVCSLDISKSDVSKRDSLSNDNLKTDKPKVPPKAKQKGSGLTAERKQYFEALSK